MYKLFFWIYLCFFIFLTGCESRDEQYDLEAVSIANRGTSLESNAVDGEQAMEPQDKVILGSSNEPGEASVGAGEKICVYQARPDFELSVKDLLNEAREGLGAEMLTPQAQLTEAARKHSIAMACENYFGHRNSDGESVEARIEKSGYQFAAIGEIIAAGFISPDEVVDAWLNSQSHLEILRNQEFSEVGVGYVFLPDDPFGHYWTVLFGHP